MTQKRKQAIVVGETGICLKCADFLLSSGWVIISIVSDDNVICDWANGHSIPILSPSQLGILQVEENFYLFNIINPYLIPQSILVHKNLVLALNYHDSPLPKYAGVNSTTWAIINNEKQHGITLHQISGGIDGGDIAAQSLIPLAKDETALPLNLKCSEHLLTLFQEVVAKIEDGTLEFLPQDLTKRTYYGIKYLPPNYGIINGIKDLKELECLARALTLGEGYDNPVATTKIFTQNAFYIVEDFNLTLKTENIPVTKKKLSLFATVRDIYRNKSDLKVTMKNLYENFILSTLDLQYLSYLKTQERKNKRQILRFFNDNPDSSCKVLCQPPIFSAA